MELTDSLSPGRQSRQLALLEADLAEKEQKLVQAAQYGSALLEENKDLRARIDQLMKQHATVLEEKQQELCNLNSRLKITECTEKWQQDELATLRAELHCVRDKMEEEKKQETAMHKKQVDTLHLDVEHLQSVEQDLRGRVADLEALLQSHLDRTVGHNTSASFNSEDMAALVEELNSLKIDLTETQARNIELCGQLQDCQREKDTVMSRLKGASAEMEDLQCQVVSYSRHLEESRREVLELRAQLDASKVDNQSHSSKGNSIFSELEDRRLVLEKKMASLKIQNEQLMEKYTIEKEQNNNYKMQIAMALQVTNQREDASAHRLREQLNEAHAEIRTLINKLQELESSKEEMMSDMRCAGGDDQFYMATLQMEKKKAAKAQGELQAKTMQYLDISQQNVQLTQHNRQLEAERDSLRSQVLKLLAQREELLTKYEPDKLKDTKVQKRVVEKIDLGDLQLQSQDWGSFTLDRQSHGLPPCPATGRASNIFRSSHPSSSMSNPSGRLSNAFKPSSASVPPGRPSDVFGGGTSSALKPVNAVQKTSHGPDLSTQVKKDVAHVASLQKENFNDTTLESGLPFMLPAGRCVTMAHDVKVIEADGEKSTVALAEDKHTSEMLKKQKAAKPPKNIKCLKANEAPEVGCKTQ